MMDSIDFSNRRKFERIPFQDKFVLEMEYFQGISNTYSKNVSEEGALLVSSEPMRQGSIVWIEIPNQKVQVMGEVVWIGPLMEADQYEVGVAFHDYLPQTKAKLSTWIDHARLRPEIPEDEQQLFSFELQSKISEFLDQFAIQDHSFSVDSYISPRRESTTEKNFMIMTPSNSRLADLTTSSFRIDTDKGPTDTLITLIALGLLFAVATALTLFRFHI